MNYKKASSTELIDALYEQEYHTDLKLTRVANRST